VALEVQRCVLKTNEKFGKTVIPEVYLSSGQTLSSFKSPLLDFLEIVGDYNKLMGPDIHKTF
jgi:hypothetical protein